MMQLYYSNLHHIRTIRGTEEVESVEDQRFNHLQGIHQNSNGNWEMLQYIPSRTMSSPISKQLRTVFAKVN